MTTGSTGMVACDIACPQHQHCEIVDAMASCVGDDCADLDCGPTEICVTTGDGAFCQDIACSADLDCPGEQHCDGTVCVDDVCTPGATNCIDDDLHACAANGSAVALKYTCGSDSYFTSACVDPGGGDAHCSCEDDWDCPAFTACAVGRCVGTGNEPTCTLAAVSLAEASPVKEFAWGGTGQNAKDAVGAPFPSSSQVSSQPAVINLDDDNGDGRVDARDIPEIVFLSYCGADVSANGIVRAVHGGGPGKGKDFFATCGDTVWHEGDDPNLVCACASATANSTASIAAGDLDGDSVPEIVVPTETAGLVVLSNTGEPITATLGNQWNAYAGPAPAIANLDNAGPAEIVVGRHVFTVANDGASLVFVDHFSGALMNGSQGLGPIPCVANIAGDSRPEIIAGTTVYRLPVPPPGVMKRADCQVGAIDPFCLGQLTVVWDGQTVNGAGAVPNAQRDGFCAVADVLGGDETAAPDPANPLDGKAEVVLIAEGTLLVFNGETGALRRSINLGAGIDGGAPVIGDLDGDGFPEIGSALALRFIVHDLQNPSASCPAWPNAFVDAIPGLQGNPARAPGGACTMDAECSDGAVCDPIRGACVCLHNGWQRVTEDDSSRVTAATVFDFNADGAAEVLYNDECSLRMYGGGMGDLLFKQPSPSRTRIEAPVVADVDDDGDAEIVAPSNNDAPSCSQGVDFPNGIAVHGDAGDVWGAARRVWNEHAYHITNVIRVA
ncbi:MAG TPA: VCBS repeat-containing protein [Nannocystis sp.]